ncbi:MAG: AAA family ATPase [Bacteroidota bacterium]
MKYLPIGIQNFKNIVSEDFVYVDKTKQIYELIKMPRSLYFLSRPRRFGKSLLVSTFRSIFLGEKEVFKGLYLYEKTDWNWKSAPILQFNFAAYGKVLGEQLENALNRSIKELALQYKVKTDGENVQNQFKSLVQNIYEKEGEVVILVDEYDKPIIDFLDDFPKADTNRAILKSFFSPLKELESKGCIRFLFITGISKFSKVSIFSDLNNLNDLSLSSKATDLLGITQEELEHYFADYIQAIAEKRKESVESLLKSLKKWYNGYSWDREMQHLVYNPFSILKFFFEGSFSNYWFATGTPTFLVNSIRQQQIDVKSIESKEVIDAFFDKFNLKSLDIFSLLFQTGYLTIKSVKLRRESYRYVLGYPNQEVKEAFIYNLIEAFSYKVPSTVGQVVLKIEDSLHDNDLPVFIEQLKILFADISYHLQPKKAASDNASLEQRQFDMWEGYFHSIIYLIISFLNIHIECEVSRHKGRLDAMVNTEHYLYLMEFKLDASADIALEQIKEKEYAQAYLNTNKKIILLGVAFDKVSRNVKTWKSEELQDTSVDKASSP